MGAPYWIAGFSSKSQVKSFDVLFDVESKSIEIHKDSQSQFQMCKFQKDICQKVLEAFEKDDIKPLEIVKVIRTQNQSLLEKVKSLGSPLTRDMIEERGFAQKTTVFL